MKTRAAVTLAVSFALVLSLLAGLPALAAEPHRSDLPGAPQKKAAAQAAPATSAPAPKTPDTAILDERVTALEKEGIVLREDLGKARLDTRTGLNDLAKRHADDMGRMQQKIDALNAQMETEREQQARRNRNLWIAIGVLALGVIASN